MPLELSGTAPTRFVEAGGTTYAYPAVADGLARERTVVLFDNAGVSRSSGATPDNVKAMAARRFLDG